MTSIQDLLLLMDKVSLDLISRVSGLQKNGAGTHGGSGIGGCDISRAGMREGIVGRDEGGEGEGGG